MPGRDPDVRIDPLFLEDLVGRLKFLALTLSAQAGELTTCLDADYACVARFVKMLIAVPGDAPSFLVQPPHSVPEVCAGSRAAQVGITVVWDDGEYGSHTI